MKNNSYNNQFSNTYFWRTQDKAEIDYIEEADGLLNAYEIKWKEQKIRFPASFLETYPNHTTNLINKENFEEFIL